jgi:hypothetical protein
MEIKINKTCHHFAPANECKWRNVYTLHVRNTMLERKKNDESEELPAPEM